MSISRTPSALLFFILASVVLASATLAQESAKPVIPATDADAMRGPKIAEKQLPPSLVHFDASGKLERLDTRPEHAAIDLLKLTPEQRKAADEVIQTRAVEVSKALQENYDLFLKLQAARQGGAKPEEIRPLMREFRPAVVSLLEPALVDKVAAALPESRREEYRTLVDEYKRAFAAVEGPGERGGGAGAGTGGGGGRGRGAAARGDASPDAMKPAEATDSKPAPTASEPTVAKSTIPPRVEMNLLLREFGRTLKGIVDERKEHMDSFLKTIDATPEQEAKIRAIARETAEKNRKNGGNGGVGELTQEEKIANWRKILEVLTPEQRRKAMEARRQ
jgi:Spy/CpxP family protein refolding chaperone